MMAISGVIKPESAAVIPAIEEPAKIAAAIASPYPTMHPSPNDALVPSDTALSSQPRTGANRDASSFILTCWLESQPAVQSRRPSDTVSAAREVSRVVQPKLA